MTYKKETDNYVITVHVVIYKIGWRATEKVRKSWRSQGGFTLDTILGHF